MLPSQLADLIPREKPVKRSIKKVAPTQRVIPFDSEQVDSEVELARYPVEIIQTVAVLLSNGQSRSAVCGVLKISETELSLLMATTEFNLVLDELAKANPDRVAHNMLKASVADSVIECIKIRDHKDTQDKDRLASIALLEKLRENSKPAVVEDSDPLKQAQAYQNELSALMADPELNLFLKSKLIS